MQCLLARYYYFVIDPGTFTDNSTISITNDASVPDYVSKGELEAQLTSSIRLILLLAHEHVLAPNGLTYADIGFTAFRQ